MNICAATILPWREPWCRGQRHEAVLTWSAFSCSLPKGGRSGLQTANSWTLCIYGGSKPLARPMTSLIEKVSPHSEGGVLDLPLASCLNTVLHPATLAMTLACWLPLNFVQDSQFALNLIRKCRSFILQIPVNVLKHPPSQTGTQTGLVDVGG